jgi:soluble lytic murein transglycosylase-like protein
MRGILVVGAVAMSLWATHAQAEDRIQAFVDSKGKLVFTNMVDENVTRPPSSAPQVSNAQTAAKTEFQIMPTIQALVTSISAKHGVDPELVVAMMKTESNFNRWAVSSKGALGLMQLIPETGRRFGVRDFFDPRQNIEGGVRYLRFLLDKFKGNVELSVAAYNAGENVVERYGRIPPIAETQDYVRKIRAIYKRPAGKLLMANAAIQDEGPAGKGRSGATGEGSSGVEVAAKEDPPKPAVIFKRVDERGVVHFTNIEPTN